MLTPQKLKISQTSFIYAHVNDDNAVSGQCALA